MKSILIILTDEEHKKAVKDKKNKQISNWHNYLLRGINE